ncbi:MAG: hypothetical protein QF825_10225, partial [SAR324 cluster bacterium]|nr:hypothetical protein [SAR324 cluster bacterium]
MDRKSIVGKKHLASSRKLGLAISLAIHAFLGFGIVAINTKPIEQADFESLEEQSIEINTLSAVELKALIALLELDPQVSEETNLPVTSLTKRNESRAVNLSQSSDEKVKIEPKPEPEPEPQPETEPEPEP